MESAQQAVIGAVVTQNGPQMLTRTTQRRGCLTDAANPFGPLRFVLSNCHATTISHVLCGVKQKIIFFFAPLYSQALGVQKPTHRKWKALSEAERAICLRVAQIREGRGWEQSRLAKQIGLSRDQLASVETGRVPLKWSAFRKLLNLWPVNPRWLSEGIGPRELNIAAPVEVGRKARKNALFSEVYEAEIKPLMAGLLSEALANELASVESGLERGDKAGPARAVLQDSTMRLLDLALQLPGDEVFFSAIKDLQKAAFGLVEAVKDQNAAGIAARMEELCTIREKAKSEAAQKLRPARPP